MTDTLTLTGVVATSPRHSVTSANVPVTSFRLASTQRRFDRAQNQWVDGDTNWYSISMFRQLARNAAVSIHKGERVVVTGRLRLREWQTSDKSGMTAEVEADALGHDLTWGSANWARTSHPSTPAAAESFPNVQSESDGYSGEVGDGSEAVLGGPADDDGAQDEDTSASAAPDDASELESDRATSVPTPF